MNSIYKTVGITKQAFHSKMDRQFKLMEEEQQLIPIVIQIREEHPAMSAKQMYRLIQPVTIGRDRFIKFCFREGFKIERKRSFQRTTNSYGVTRFDNLITGRELTGINQIYVSDITYYRIGNMFYYLTFIMDLYSRNIVGYSVSDNLLTESTTIPALKMALKNRKHQPGLIFHSDGGGQYYSKNFLKITQKYKIKNSMCESVYENANAERINGTIKNDYLFHYHPQDLTQLKQQLKRAVNNYNQTKPHKALKGNSPAQFEQLLTNDKSLLIKQKVA